MRIDRLRKHMLAVGTSVPALALLCGLAAPAAAQDAVGAQLCDPVTGDCNEPWGSAASEIVVTGTLFRSGTDTEIASPITTLSAQALAERGLNTVSEAVQRLPANNAGTLQDGWNTGFSFTPGANAPALRGLTVQSTLSIADGLRMAPYPLADDGQRNFVDLNTIPSAIIDRVEILRDGASSTYGADAIAGVINVVTKREIRGLHLNASTGFSQEADALEQRVDATWGHGDLASQGFNFYVSGEYHNQDGLHARQRGYPFNTQDWTGICGESGSCMRNLNWNGFTPELYDLLSGIGLPTSAALNGLASIPNVSLVRPAPAGAFAGLGRFEYLNPEAGCRDWPSYMLPDGVSGVAPSTVCEVDFQNRYMMLRPDIERLGLTGRFTARVGNRAEVYGMVNFYNTQTSASYTPMPFAGTPPPGGNEAAPVPQYNVMLPVYVCPTGVGTLNGMSTGCDATNGTLNPYNPYAAAGQTAQLALTSSRPRTVETDTRALRGTLGIDGSFGDNWDYSASFTASEMRLDWHSGNFFIPQRIADVLARGELNLFDLEASPQSVWDTIAPMNSTRSVSDLWQVQATLAKELFELPGGPLRVAVGASYREESIDAPSANPDIAPGGNPYERYYGINAVGATGSRDVTSAFFEVDAPILDSLTVVGSGRYDDYSTGQDNFSPKVGLQFRPVRQLLLRGTWSEGFRIPSFNEAFGLPTTGYMQRRVNCAEFTDYCAAHGNNAYAMNPYVLGVSDVGNPDLDPERSTSFTAGVVFEPIRDINLTVDFWHIKVRGLITGLASTTEIERQYYANNGVVDIPGITVIPGRPDTANPDALPQLGFIKSAFTNQNSQEVSGLDFGVNARVPLAGGVTFRTAFDASWLMKYRLNTQDGEEFNYEGTLSPCGVSSCSGSPEWRASWQNSLDLGATTLSLTAYFTDGYDTASIDTGGEEGNCQMNALYRASTAIHVDSTPVNCRQDAIWNVDFTARHALSEQVSVYLDVLNVLDLDAPFDPSGAYGLLGYNPAWAGPNIMGRYFRLGARFNF